MTNDPKTTGSTPSPAKTTPPASGRKPAATPLAGGSYIDGNQVAGTKPPPPVDGAKVRAEKRRKARERTR